MGFDTPTFVFIPNSLPVELMRTDIPYVLQYGSGNIDLFACVINIWDSNYTRAIAFIFHLGIYVLKKHSGLLQQIYRVNGLTGRCIDRLLHLLWSIVDMNYQYSGCMSANWYSIRHVFTVGERTVVLKIIARCSITQNPNGQWNIGNVAV